MNKLVAFHDDILTGVKIVMSLNDLNLHLKPSFIQDNDDLGELENDILLHWPLPANLPMIELAIMEKFALEENCPELCPTTFSNSIPEFRLRVKRMNLEEKWQRFRNNYFKEAFILWADKNHIDPNLFGMNE